VTRQLIIILVTLVEFYEAYIDVIETMRELRLQVTIPSLGRDVHWLKNFALHCMSEFYMESTAVMNRDNCVL